KVYLARGLSRRVHLEPAHPERALTLRGDDTAVLIGDLHIGLEVELEKDGLRLPSQTAQMAQRVVGLLERTGASRLVILGDLKHTIPFATAREAVDLRRFFERISAKVDLVPGNHDAALPPLPDHVTIHPAAGLLLGDVGVGHGHVWPSQETMGAREIVTCHNHPSVLLQDELGHRHKEPAWIRGPFSKTARVRYPKLPLGAKFVVMPNFNDLLGGVAFNSLPAEEMLGPLLRNRLFDVERAKVHTLDGIDLGQVGSLRKGKV
ncbi:MAG TPA: metallophosphoesterase, partial [Burkholderiales bacterium]|nr:metallophosphoesterase [Burkholderiales bacterium]